MAHDYLDMVGARRKTAILHTLRTMRAEGCSYHSVARELERRHGVVVTGQTVRVWDRKHLGVTPVPEAPKPDPVDPDPVA